MNEEEAEMLGVSLSERRRLLRMDSAKVNIAPPSTEARWFKLVGVRLGNPTMLYPGGDEVATVERWEPTGLWSLVSNTNANAILDVLDAGMPDGRRYSAAPQSTDRAAWQVVREHIPELTEAQAKAVIREWWKNTGLIDMREYDDPTRRDAQKGIFVNPAKRPS